MERIIKRVIQFYKGTFFIADLSAGKERENANVSGYTFKEIKKEIFSKDPIFAQKNRAQDFCKNVDEGHRCYGFFDPNGRVASYIWLSIAKEEISVPWIFGLRLFLAPGTAYIWNCFTAEDHRKRGLYKSGLQNAKPICSKNGIKSLSICSASDNIYSKGGIISTGFNEIFNFSGVCVGPTCFIKKAKDNRYKIALKGQTKDFING